MALPTSSMPTKRPMAAASNSSSACSRICVALVHKGFSCITLATLRLARHGSFHWPEKTGRQSSKSNTALPAKSGSSPHPLSLQGAVGVGLHVGLVKFPAIWSRTAPKSRLRLASCGMPPLAE